MIRQSLNWPARRPWSAVAIAAVLAILSALSTRRLRPDTSLQSLFSADDPAARALDRVLTDFPMAEEMLVLVTTPGDQPRHGSTARLRRTVGARGSPAMPVRISS